MRNVFHENDAAVDCLLACELAAGETVSLVCTQLTSHLSLVVYDKRANEFVFGLASGIFHGDTDDGSIREREVFDENRLYFT